MSLVDTMESFIWYQRPLLAWTRANGGVQCEQGTRKHRPEK